MRTMMLPMLFLMCVPMSAQHSTVPYVEEDWDAAREVYALAGYSNTWEPAYPGFYNPGPRPPARHWGGGYIGVGVGARAANSLAGVQAEFFQVRNSGSSRWPHLNTGAINLVLEKRTGRIRPGGIVIGLGGATDGPSTFLFVQFAAGVAVQLNDRFYVRPQVRFQGWVHDVLFGTGNNPTALSAGIALGYRF
jgi:hypothetical protein